MAQTGDDQDAGDAPPETRATFDIFPAVGDPGIEEVVARTSEPLTGLWDTSTPPTKKQHGDPEQTPSCAQAVGELFEPTSLAHVVRKQDSAGEQPELPSSTARRVEADAGDDQRSLGVAADPTDAQEDQEYQQGAIPLEGDGPHGGVVLVQDLPIVALQEEGVREALALDQVVPGLEEEVVHGAEQGRRGQAHPVLDQREYADNPAGKEEPQPTSEGRRAQRLRKLLHLAGSDGCQAGPGQHEAREHEEDAHLGVSGAPPDPEVWQPPEIQLEGTVGAIGRFGGEVELIEVVVV
nr:hypothetical protein CFP56_12971 [Quercus suber]